jgi:hypothetical protein
MPGEQSTVAAAMAIVRALAGAALPKVRAAADAAPLAITPFKNVRRPIGEESAMMCTFASDRCSVHECCDLLTAGVKPVFKHTRRFAELVIR